ncbi:MAG: glycosyltransferase [Azospirillaceae bacterium]
MSTQASRSFATLADTLPGSCVAAPPPQRAAVGPATDGPYLDWLMSPRQHLVYAGFVTVWLAALVWCWAWWLDGTFILSTTRYVALTVVLLWLSVLQVYFVSVVAFAKVPSPRCPIPEGRVAIVVTKAPSEPWAMVKTTLEAMLAQDVPHDTWLADEDPSAETLAWCHANGVQVSTRKGRADYHRKEWPRRTRCKEGNLAYFYDHYGYERYDFVAQLDADHVPQPGYLRAMLRPFANPRVGYVSAPSICDANAQRSWSARGRLYFESMLHGIMQSGYSGAGLASLCIGSHYAVRTKALRAVGGLGPELAEDHSTTLLMNSGGWRGIHAVNAIAHGDGPITFSDLVTQEFQWSRSLVTLLVRYTRHYVGRLPWRLKAQFLFCQLWYPFSALAMLMMYVMPLWALATNQAWANVGYGEFIVHFVSVNLIVMALVQWLRWNGWGRPSRSKTIGWEGLLFLFARWPWMLVGTIEGVRRGLTGKETEFRITPKGMAEVGQLPVRILAPYAGLSCFSSVLPLMLPEASEAAGFYLFAGLNGFIYAFILFTVLRRHRMENGIIAKPNLKTLSGCFNSLLLPGFLMSFAVLCVAFRFDITSAAFLSL